MAWGRQATGGGCGGGGGAIILISEGVPIDITGWSLDTPWPRVSKVLSGEKP